MRRPTTRYAHWILAGLACAAAVPAVGQGAPETPGIRGLPAECPQVAPDTVLDLAQASARALCQDPRTRLSWAQWQAEAAQWLVERAAAWPTLDARAGVGRSWDRLKDGGAPQTTRGTVFDTAFEMSWLVFDFGQQRATQQSARLAAAAAAAAHDVTVRQVALDVAEAYWALAEAEAVWQVLEEEARFTDDLLAQDAARAAPPPPPPPPAPASRKPARGGAKAAARPAPPKPPTAEELAEAEEAAQEAALERLQMRADQSRAAYDRRVAQGDMLQARGAMAVLLGLPPGSLVRIAAEDTSADDSLGSAGFEQVLQDVVREHPALREARASLGAAGAELEAARRTGAPRLSLEYARRGSRDTLRITERETSVGLVLEVPLFAGFERRAREQRARALLDGARAELRQAEQDVALQTWAAYQDFQTHLVALRHARTHEDDSRALLAGELASYRQGRSDLQDVLYAHVAASEAVIERLSSLRALRMARVRLGSALGRLPHAPFKP